MSSSTSSARPTYSAGFVTGGIWTSALSGLSLIIVVLVSVFDIAEIPTGVPTFVGVAVLVGTFLIIGGILLHELEEQRVDHFVISMVTQDVAALDRDVKALTRQLKRVTALLDNVMQKTRRQERQRDAEDRPRSRRSRRPRRGASGGDDNVIPLRARGAADALRRFTERIDGDGHA